MSEIRFEFGDFKVLVQIDMFQKIGFGVGALGFVGFIVGFVIDLMQFYKLYFLVYVFVLGVFIGSFVRM